MTAIAAVPTTAPNIAYNKGRTFFLLLGLATAIPYFGMPFAPLVGSPSLASFVLACWIFTGYGHVLATLWFGLDDEYRPVIGQHRARMIGALIALPLLTVAVTVASKVAAAWLFTGFTAWLVHHYNRQTYGIIGLAAAHDGYGRLPAIVSNILHVTTIAGAVRLVTMASIIPGGVSPFASPSLIAISWYVSLAATVTAVAGVIVLFCRDSGLRRSPTMLLFLTLASIFYVPSLLPGSPMTYFWPFALAHGAQYIIMMLALSGRSARGTTGLAVTMLIILALSPIAYALGDMPWVQLYTGLVMWHFLADARLWRMRDPLVRTIVRSRFDFLFRTSAPALGSSRTTG